MVARTSLLYFSIFLLLTPPANGDNPTGCGFPTHLSPEKKNGEKQIQKLIGKRFQTSDDDFKYYIGICTAAISPLPGDLSADIGVLQESKEETPSYKAVGKFTSADIIAGSDWVLLEYNDGDRYGNHCKGTNDTGEKRKARIMFICDRASKETQPVVLEEQNNKTNGCYYLFEFSTDAVCPELPLITFGLSVGSVLLIVFFSVLAFYLIAGCAYNRFMLGSKGLQQIPNLSFWEDFGNLQADGCDLVCRSKKSRQPKTYKGIGDDQLQEEEERTDDHLLPM